MKVVCGNVLRAERWPSVRQAQWINQLQRCRCLIFNFSDPYLRKAFLSNWPQRACSAKLTASRLTPVNSQLMLYEDRLFFFFITLSECVPYLNHILQGNWCSIKHQNNCRNLLCEFSSSVFPRLGQANTTKATFVSLKVNFLLSSALEQVIWLSLSEPVSVCIRSYSCSLCTKALWQGSDEGQDDCDLLVCL